MLVSAETVSTKTLQDNISIIYNDIFDVFEIIIIHIIFFTIIMEFQVLGGIGGLIASVMLYGFMSFLLWSTFFLSGLLVLLNVLNVYQALKMKISFLVYVVNMFILMDRNIWPSL